jgi:leader peptidase (prepilin peptidase)/N-methyltransferase
MALRTIGVVVAIGLAVVCFLVIEPLAAAAVGAAGCAVLVAVSVTDLERRIIPNRIIVPATAVAVVVQTLREPSLEWLLAALGAGGFFLVAALVYPAGLGMGDVKLAGFLGAWLGTSVVVALFFGSLLAAVPAVVLLAVKGSSARKIGLPFAPFLAGGALIALFWGDALIEWWIG